VCHGGFSKSLFFLVPQFAFGAGPNLVGLSLDVDPQILSIVDVFDVDAKSHTPGDFVENLIVNFEREVAHDGSLADGLA